MRVPIDRLHEMIDEPRRMREHRDPFGDHEVRAAKIERRRCRKPVPLCSRRRPASPWARRTRTCRSCGPHSKAADRLASEWRCGVLLDKSRRDDVGYLVAMYDALVEQAAGEARDTDLAQVQRWLCRVTGMSSLSARRTLWESSSVPT